MKKNRGFTLVELLAVILILGLLAAIIVPGITSVLKNNKQKLYEVQLELIEKSAKTYISENMLTFDFSHEFTIYLKQLQEKNYIDNDIKNPKTNGSFGSCLEIIVSPKNLGSSHSGYTVNINEETINKLDGC